MSDFHVQRLDHVHVAVKDRASAIAWYGRVFGLRKHYDYTERGDRLGPVVLSSDGGETHLALFDSKDAVPCSQTVAFRVDAAGFLTFLRRLEDLEVLDDQGKRVMPKDASDHYNLWLVYFCDPDGNSYEITTYDYKEVASRVTALRERSA
jgi:catechol 2,3-dioxygenase-like lactoylglutathione lyase family enzyme